MTLLTSKVAFSNAGTMRSGAEWPDLPAEYHQERWYAAYTNANHERRVAEQLGVREVEHFLPTYSSVRRWKDRRVTLQLPLFPGYVFVRMALRDRLKALQVPGVARLVGFDGTPAALPDEEIEALRVGFASGVRAEPHPFLTIGRRVQVKTGPLAGMQGILLRRKGSLRVVISIELIQRSIMLEVDAASVLVLRDGKCVSAISSIRREVSNGSPYSDRVSE